MWTAVALWLEHRTLNHANPVLIPLAAVLVIFFTPHCFSSISGIDEFLAIDRQANLL